MGLKQKLQQQKQTHGYKRNIFNTLLENEGEPRGLKNKMSRFRKVQALYKNNFS